MSLTKIDNFIAVSPIYRIKWKAPSPLKGEDACPRGEECPHSWTGENQKDPGGFCSRKGKFAREPLSRITWQIVFQSWVIFNSFFDKGRVLLIFFLKFKAREFISLLDLK